MRRVHYKLFDFFFKEEKICAAHPNKLNFKLSLVVYSYCQVYTNEYVKQ